MKTYKSITPKISLVMEKSDFEKVRIEKSEDAANYIRKFYSTDIEIYESFFILLLNRFNYTIGYAKISQGGVTGTVADVRIIAKYAIDSLSSGVILCHNHPSGNKTPSRPDEDLTSKVKETLKLFDCNVFDHIILVADGYYSFSDEGKL